MRVRSVAFSSVLAGTLALQLLPGSASAVTYTVLHTFTGGADGGMPQSGLIRDKSGTLYGTALRGGANNEGVVFTIAPNGTETVLHSFSGSDGAYPWGALQPKKSGGFYGTTVEGGVNNQGTVYKLSPKGKESVVYSFAGGNDGDEPLAGGLVGTTQLGGANNLGTVYKIVKGHETVLHTFGGMGDGGYPYDAVIKDKAGNFYGTAAIGGANSKGIVFRLAPDGTESILYSFCAAANCTDGASPIGGLIFDSAGNLYGTTSFGGARNSGTVFKLAPDGTETVLYSFCAGGGLCSDGAFPYAGVIGDPATGFYGTTQQGGAKNGGAVFELAPDGTETVLHSFSINDGYYPQAPLVMDKKGNLYGTASGGGQIEGNVFEISP